MEFAKDEILRIMKSPQARNGRSDETIFRACKIGAVAEKYLQDKFGFVNNPKMYYDLISPDGLETEVKAYLPHNLTGANVVKNIMAKYPYNKSKVWIFFSVNNDVYTIFKLHFVK
jgi:hypothetical protein